MRPATPPPASGSPVRWPRGPRSGSRVVRWGLRQRCARPGHPTTTPSRPGCVRPAHAEAASSGWGRRRRAPARPWTGRLYLRDDGRVSFGYLNGNSRTAVSSTSAINDGVWHHVVATRTAGATRLYVDGALAASGGTNTTSSTTGWWRLGGDRLTSWPNTPRNTHLAGDLDEVAVYGKALSASAVFAHYATARPAADATPPSAVSGLAATVGANGVTLAWDSATDNVGVVRYEVYRSNDPSVPLTAGNLIGQPTTTSWTDEVAPGAWNYRVRAVDSAGNAGPASAVQSVDTSGPTQVTGLELTRTPGGVSLSWAAATDNVGVVTYRVYRTSSPTSPLTAADLVAEGASTSATDTPPPATWSYRVVAVDGAGNVGPASDPVTRDLAPPSAPTAFVGSANGTAITLTWAAATDNEGVVGYEVLRSATPDAGVDGSTVIATVSTTTRLGHTRGRVLGVPGESDGRSRQRRSGQPSGDRGQQCSGAPDGGHRAGLARHVRQPGSTLSHVRHEHLAGLARRHGHDGIQRVPQPDAARRPRGEAPHQGHAQGPDDLADDRGLGGHAPSASDHECVVGRDDVEHASHVGHGRAR